MARIVVADNDPDALDLLIIDLRLEGHTVDGAVDGESALALVASSDPDVIVLDYRMGPGPNGLEVAVELRSTRPLSRVLIYSNYWSPDVVRAAAEHGITFLAKGNLRTLRALVGG